MSTFSAIQLSYDLPIEEVSEIFVRVNSKGTQLNQADFILTLMSVFWEKGRRELEDFARAAKTPTLSQASPFDCAQGLRNVVTPPSFDHLRRWSPGISLNRR